MMPGRIFRETMYSFVKKEIIFEFVYFYARSSRRILSWAVQSSGAEVGEAMR